MDAHLFRLFFGAAGSLLAGARIGKVQQPMPGLITIDIFNAGKKRQLCWHYGHAQPFCFFGENRLSSAQPPSGQIMRIRKYFADRAIASVVCQFCQRRLWLLASSRGEVTDKTVWLCLDFANGASLHFNESGLVPEPDQPAWPQADQLDQALENWRSWPVLSPALRKELRRQDKPDQAALLQDLQAGNGFLFIQKNEIGQPVSASAWPCGGNEVEYGDDEPGDGGLLAGFALAGQALVLDRLYAQKQDQLARPVRRQIARLEKLLQKLDEDEKRLRGMLARVEDAKAIAANLWKIDGSVHLPVIELESESGQRKISLDERLSVQENMERFFHNAKRGRRGLAMLTKRREETRAKMTDPVFSEHSQTEAKSEKNKSGQQESGQLALAAMRQNLPKNVQATLSSDGYILLCGRDAKGNTQARRLGSPHDIWAHVETGPGAHVIIRRPHGNHNIPARTLDEAGAIAAGKSWLKNAPAASIMYAELRHVHPDRKGGEGNVLIDRILETRLVRLPPPEKP